MKMFCFAKLSKKTNIKTLLNIYKKKNGIESKIIEINFGE